MMSSPVSPPQPTTLALRRASWPGADMRVGDAERAEIADHLARHFSDGRLDEAEFSERLDQAMRAKTMADLSGLLSDLPGSDPAAARRPPPSAQDAEGPARTGAACAAARAAGAPPARARNSLADPALDPAADRADRGRNRDSRHTLTHSIGAWLVIGFIAFLWLRRSAAAVTTTTGTGREGTRRQSLRDGPAPGGY